MMDKIFKMRTIAILVSLLASLSVNAQNIDALQPYAPHWFIFELLKWTPENDKDAPFNKSNTPLVPKHFNEDLKVNNHARPNEANIEMLPIFGNTHKTPSQGSLDINFYTFTYWQYCDLIVYWGGSSNEGIILAPTAGVIDAAHRHGVPVYGTVFFPPIVYGGKRDWVYHFVQKDEQGHFPVADKLIEAARYYGFDGWFINQETGNTGEVEPDEKLANDMKAFMHYYKNNSNLSIQWYDAMLADGTVKWQHELNEKNEMFFQDGKTIIADQMFLDFRFTKKNLINTERRVKELERNIYDIYGGIDVQSNGYETKPGYKYPDGANFDVLFPEDLPHAASLAFYVPSWTFSSSSGIQEFYQKESRFWVGVNGDPSATECEHNWKGVAHYVPAKSAIGEQPFVTCFNTGQGYKFFRNGKDITSPTWTKGWNNLTLQDIQPTWRWLVEGEQNGIDIKYDYTDAFNGGNCILITTKTNKENLIPLYSTQIHLTTDSRVIITYKKSKASKLAVELCFADKTKEINDLSQLTKGESWVSDTIALNEYAGKELIRLGLKVSGVKNGSQQIKIGKLGILEDVSKKITQPSNIRVLAKTVINDNLNIRLTWDDGGDELNYYRIYKLDDFNLKYFLGATSSNACYLPLVPLEKNSTVKLGVEKISKDFLTSDIGIIELSAFD